MTRTPLPIGRAVAGLVRSVGASSAMLARGNIHHPREHVGRQFAFADGTSARMYRETVVDRPPPDDPCTLVVKFRLRGVRGRGHRAFRAESLLNTPLFIGFPGFVGKWWLAHDEKGFYRGIYEWDGPDRAETYARALWWVLAAVSVRGSIHWRVLPGVRRDALAANSRLPDPDADLAWWRPITIP